MLDNTILDSQARLAELKRLLVMDTADEVCYDDLTRLAAQICDTPIALISLIDDKRQWFKSRVGLLARQTPREFAFCAHAVAAHRSLLVEDAASDPRFQHNPLVTGEPGIRFYAGALLMTRNGQALGTLCVIDRKPRTLTANQMEQLEFMARQVVEMLELRAQQYGAPPAPGQAG
ncbi:hypothetical protein RD110_14680 [Rhodoferax koreense]|uniref:GAF domain-containing protein n=1 Tax=Rhodoferax koreensis TaxID=1842727 RepID=A0A1P8JWZ2_9BURK|nr:GAF domain-containing protein [Rhodoferax koreense]APW38282.1 hypothetical protein RD110_14680 [Rhodoferax koreense]